MRGGRAHHPSALMLLSAATMHQAAGGPGSCQVSEAECKVNRIRTKAFPNPSSIHPKNQ